jgi:pheromone shutdown protein TraB
MKLEKFIDELIDECDDSILELVDRAVLVVLKGYKEGTEQYIKELEEVKYEELEEFQQEDLRYNRQTLMGLNIVIDYLSPPY